MDRRIVCGFWALLLLALVACQPAPAEVAHEPVPVGTASPTLVAPSTRELPTPTVTQKVPSVTPSFTLTPTATSASASGSHSKGPTSTARAPLLNYATPVLELVETISVTAPDGNEHQAMLLRLYELAAGYGEHALHESCQPEIVSETAALAEAGASLLATRLAVPNRDDLFVAQCGFVNWTTGDVAQVGFLSAATLVPAGSRAVALEHMKAEGYSSDINGNGWPEITVWHATFSNGQNDFRFVDSDFYELQSDGTLVNITAGIPHFVNPFHQIVLPGVPPTIFALNVEGWIKWTRIDTWYLYTWDGQQFVDNTPGHAELIMTWGEALAETVRVDYGQPITYWRGEFHQILRQYDAAGLRTEGLALFLELTESDNWPGTDFHFRCWLQVSRTMAQEEMAAGQAFSIGPFEDVLGDGGYPEACDGLDD